MEKIIDTDQIIGVIVLYNKRLKESETVISLNKSVQHSSVMLDMIVYDNSLLSDLTNSEVFIYDSLRIHYFHDASNPGVSKAYNFAAKVAKQLNKQWILLLDQDTTFPLESIEKYVQAIHQLPDIKLFSPILKLGTGNIFSPCRYYFKRGFGLKNITIGINSFQHISPLNSGMLIDLDSFGATGGYNENVKLDFSDFQFIERFKKMYSYFYVLDLICIQDFSNSETDAKKLNSRYMIYCRDAINCDRTSFWDGLEYFIVLFIRANTLAFRTKNPIFYKTLFQNYLH